MAERYVSRQSHGGAGFGSRSSIVFSIFKGLLFSGFELLLSHGVVGLRVLNLLLSPTPSPIDSAGLMDEILILVMIVK